MSYDIETLLATNKKRLEEAKQAEATAKSDEKEKEHSNMRQALEHIVRELERLKGNHGK